MPYYIAIKLRSKLKEWLHNNLLFCNLNGVHYSLCASIGHQMEEDSPAEHGFGMFSSGKLTWEIKTVYIKHHAWCWLAASMNNSYRRIREHSVRPAACWADGRDKGILICYVVQWSISQHSAAASQLFHLPWQETSEQFGSSMHDHVIWSRPWGVKNY